ncbi:MAG: hypothetical protein HYS05_11930 [Acidobacteria bacterium]|nr:hypothetical protein [Acidobacteriota bacterium]
MLGECCIVYISEALDELEKDDLVKETRGEHILDHFLEAKREEWQDYIKAVSPWEIQRYLGISRFTGLHVASRGCTSVT